MVKAYADAKMPAQSKQARRTWLSKWIKSKKVYRDPPPLKDSLPVIYWRHGRLLTQQDTILERARLYSRCAIQHKKGVSYTRDPKAPVPAKEKRKPPKDHNGSDEEDMGDEGTQPPKGAKKPRNSRKKNSVFISEHTPKRPVLDSHTASQAPDGGVAGLPLRRRNRHAAPPLPEPTFARPGAPASWAKPKQEQQASRDGSLQRGSGHIPSKTLYRPGATASCHHIRSSKPRHQQPNTDDSSRLTHSGHQRHLWPDTEYIGSDQIRRPLQT